MQSTMTRRLLALALAAMMLGLAGCNTMEGLGKDIQSAGRALEGEAEESDADSE